MTVLSTLLEIQSSLTLLTLEVDGGEVATAATKWATAGLTVRVVRGEKMRSTADLMDELSAALQFPHYFGGNWAALGECLADMDWLFPTVGIVVLVRDAEQVLIHESSVELEALIAVIGKASHEYSEPIALGEWWDRPAVPFHVVLQAVRDLPLDAPRRWESAGAQTESLT